MRADAVPLTMDPSTGRAALPGARQPAGGEEGIVVDAARFDAFARSVAGRPTRRRLLRLLAGVGLGGILLRPTGRASAVYYIDCPKITCPTGSCILCEYNADGSVCSCGCTRCTVVKGIVGGGSVRVGGGVEATVTLLATRVADPAAAGGFGVVGQVAWTDPAWEGAGLSLESVGLASYRPLEGVDGGREVAGWMRTDRAPGDHPFVLRAVDAGPAGNGTDTVALWVGDAVTEDPDVAGRFAATPVPGGFRYRAKGSLVAGDLRLVDLPGPGGEELPATPAP
jgi:hypothetical protein